MEPVYSGFFIQWILYIVSGHSWDTTSWLLYRSGLFIQWNFIQCNLYNSGHSWDTTSWLLYRGGLFIQWNLYIVVTLETQPVGCYTEVACLYSGTCIIVVTLGTQPVGCYTEVAYTCLLIFSWYTILQIQEDTGSGVTFTRFSQWCLH